MFLPLYMNLGLGFSGGAGTGEGGGASGGANGIPISGNGLVGRTPRPTFALSSDGSLYIATGYKPLLRWDGLMRRAVPAGMPAPDRQVSIESSGQGLISGTVRAVMRWVDDRGNFSNFSPIGDSYEIKTSTGQITDVSSDSPIVITSANHGLVTGDGVWVEQVHGNWAANGQWVVTVIDANRFSLNNSVSSGFFETSSEAIWWRGSGQLTYSNITPPPDSRVKRLQILRTRSFTEEVYWLDIDTDEINETSYVSTKTDDQLTLRVPLVDAENNELNQARYGEPPNYKKVAVHHLGRMFLASDGVYDAGAVIATNGSKIVTGIATDWVDELKFRQIYFSDVTYNDEAYTIASIDSATQLTLDRDYIGPSTAYSRYEIRPTDRERRTLFYSSAGLPEAFDIGAGLTFSEMKESGDLVGIMPYQSWLYVFFEHRTYRISYQNDPATGQTYLDTWRGVVNQHCWVIVEGTAYMMDRQGVYAYGDGGFRDVSAFIRPMFSKGHEYSIHWEHSDGFHAVHDPATEVIRWFVSLGGSRYPQHAICYEYRMGRWWIEEYPVPAISSTLGRIDGRHTVFIGSAGHRVYAMNEGSLDLVSQSDGTIRGTVTAAGPLTITDSSATFPTADDDWIGAAIAIVSGTGAGQKRLIAEVSTDTIEVDQPWDIQPTAGSVYQVGGVSWQFRTGWFANAVTEEHDKRAFEIVFTPTEDESRLQVQVFEDRHRTGWTNPRRFGLDGTKDGVTFSNGSPFVAFDTRDQAGWMVLEYDGTRATRRSDPRSTRFEMEGVTNTEEHEIHQLFIEGVYAK